MILTTAGKTTLGTDGWDTFLYLGIGDGTDAEVVGLTQFSSQLARVAIQNWAVSAGVLTGSAYFPSTDAARTIRQVGLFQTSATATLLLYKLLTSAEYITLAAGESYLYDLSGLFNSAVT